MFRPLALMAFAGLAAFGCKPADRLAPRWDVLRAPPALVVLGDTLPEPVVEALDDRDCRLDDAVVREGFVDTERWGDYALAYRVADAAGNEADTTFPVRVTAVPASYWASDWNAVDTCSDGTTRAYAVRIQDCECPDDRAVLFNLGNFGPGSFVDLLMDGAYRQELAVARTTSSLSWAGSGLASRAADTLWLDWTVDNGATVLGCATRLVRP